MESNKNKQIKTAVIIGAGPAGLTAAYEMLTRTPISPIILESDKQVGGLAKTIRCSRGLLDIGGHRFFTKSNRVLAWWISMLPPTKRNRKAALSFFSGNIDILDFSKTSRSLRESMLVRSRLSKIFFRGKLFEYPPHLGFVTFRNLGVTRSVMIVTSYFFSKIFPVKPEKSLEDFFINRFGKSLYKIFFRSYTEKVWGLTCNKISASWGRQRIRGVSLLKVIANASLKISFFHRKKTKNNTEISLIEWFLYPSKGPGQLWETVEKKIVEKGGVVKKGKTVIQVKIYEKNVESVTVIDEKTGLEEIIVADVFLSSMPLKDLFAAIQKGSGGLEPDRETYRIAKSLKYRDFISIGVALSKKTVEEKSQNMLAHQLKDNWLYIQDQNVLVGRIQLFHNWSPYMTDKREILWLGMEYFCSETDEIWEMNDVALGDLAVSELEKLGFAEKRDVLDTYVIRAKKAYPGYFGESYQNFERIRKYLESIENLYPIGRNGMHRYNNQDHSMLTAMAVVDSLLGLKNKDDIWSVNEEEEYHEEK